MQNSNPINTFQITIQIPLKSKPKPNPALPNPQYNNIKN